MVDIQSLIAQGEHSRLEAKKASGGIPDSLWESYSAFANTGGGVILLGVSELNNQLVVSGVKEAQNKIKNIWDILNNRQKISTNVLMEKHVYVQPIAGKEVIVMEVPRAERHDKPVYIKNDLLGETYRRNKEGDYRCTPQSVKAMLRDQSDLPTDSTVINELTWKDLDMESIMRYRNRFSSLKPSHVWNGLDTLEFCADVKRPFKMRNYLEREDDTAVHKAIREALANSLIHADYYGRQGIVIEKRKNEIKIANPGSCRPDILEVKEGGVSDPRNPAIFKMFAMIDIGERAGSGVFNICTVWKEMGWKEPVLQEKFDPERTIVVLPIENGWEKKISATAPEKNDNAPEKVRNVPEKKSTIQDKRLLSILEIIDKNKKVTMNEMAKFLNVNDKTIKRDMQRLKAKGFIERIGADKGGYWSRE